MALNALCAYIKITAIKAIVLAIQWRKDALLFLEHYYIFPFQEAFFKIDLF